jgi:hypothetical protein
MNLRQILTTLKHDPAWLDRYLAFVTHPAHPQGSIELHHILPRAVFPEYASFEEFPKNRVALSPSDHFIAHYYLFRAYPGNPSIMMAFRMMVGRYFRPLKQHGYSEEFAREIAAAYEVAKRAGRPWNDEARQRRSESMKGCPVHDGLTRKGAIVSEETKKKMSDTQSAAYVQNPGAPQFTNKPSGPEHWAYGKERDPETRAKISAALTGHEAPDITRVRMSNANVSNMLDAITPEEDQAFRAALLVKTEEEMLAIRKGFKINSRPYNVMTGLITIRLGRREQVAARYWQQAWNWLQAAKLIWWEVKSATTRLGTGHPLAPNQQSAHQLRNTGLGKGIGAARKAYAEIPADEHRAMLNAWGTGHTPTALVAERRNWPVRGKAYNILFGMQWIAEGKATAATFERWRQAALFLRLSGREVPLGPEAMAALDRVCPAGAII